MVAFYSYASLPEGNRKPPYLMGKSMVKPVPIFPTQRTNPLKPTSRNPAEMQMNWRYNQHENQQWDGDIDHDVDNGNLRKT